MKEKQVPKCEGCELLKTIKIGVPQYYTCLDENIGTKASDGYNFGKKVYAKDMKTSPKWCPKRVLI